MDDTPVRETERFRPAELVKFLRAIGPESDHFFLWCITSLNTLGQPEAVLDLTRWQIDLDDRLIDLNPRGRKQNKKYRPVVPISETLLPYLKAVTGERVVSYAGRPVKNVKTAFAATRRRAGVNPRLTPYSMRHYVASWTMSSKVFALDRNARISSGLALQATGV